MALIKCPECNKEISDTSDTCIHCGYKIKNTIDSNQDVQNTNSNGKVIIHGHTESEMIKDLPIKIYEGDTLIVELERLGTFEFNLNKDTTLTFKYGKYKPTSYDFKANQDEEIFLSLNMNWGKIKIKSNRDNQPTIISDNGSISNAKITKSTAEKKKNPRLIIFGALAVILLISFISYCISPMNESKACTEAQMYVKKNMRDPSSAKFENDCRVIKDNTNNNLWYVQGTVRGTNGFGGVYTQRYAVTMLVDGSNYEVKGVSFY